MKVRLGYVAISNKLGKKITSSSTVTYTNYQKIINEKERLNKLKKVTLSNLNDLIKILKYNEANNIHFYRITSKLIPLATHPEVGDWGYRKIFKKDFEYIGKLLKKTHMRVDTHPDQFNVINSAKQEVFDNTVKTLMKHVELFEMLDYRQGKMIIHIGGATGGKEKALERFIENFKRSPSVLQHMLMLENDDKTYTAKETLQLCQALGLPMVLDVHHHDCNPGEENIDDLLGDILKTWDQESLPPKFHFSSPKEHPLDKKHADFIEAEAFACFIDRMIRFKIDFDVMLECKEKDIALYKLAEDLKEIRPNYSWLDTSTFEIT